MAYRLCDGMHRTRGPILYIYSLGHFLTTKGALIDGDWGGQFFAIFHQKGSKMSEKISKIDQNLSSKMSEKNVILNGKSEKVTKK